MTCRSCTHFLDAKDCCDQNQREMSFCGFAGACVHPTNFHRVVYLTPKMAETGRCGRLTNGSYALRCADPMEGVTR